MGCWRQTPSCGRCWCRKGRRRRKRPPKPQPAPRARPSTSCPAGRHQLGEAAQALPRYRSAALPELRRRGTEDHRGDSGAAGDREAPYGAGAAVAAADEGPGGRAGAASRGLRRRCRQSLASGVRRAWLRTTSLGGAARQASPADDHELVGVRENPSRRLRMRPGNALNGPGIGGRPRCAGPRCQPRCRRCAAARPVPVPTYAEPCAAHGHPAEPGGPAAANA